MALLKFSQLHPCSILHHFEHQFELKKLRTDYLTPTCVIEAKIVIPCTVRCRHYSQAGLIFLVSVFVCLFSCCVLLFLDVFGVVQRNITSQPKIWLLE